MICAVKDDADTSNLNDTDHEQWKFEERQRIAQGAYGGFENTQVCWLYRNLPNGHAEYDDLYQIVRMWSLDAVNRYDKKYGAKFSTFLFGHLRMCSLRYQREPWGSTRKPKDRNVLCISQGWRGKDKKEENKAQTALDEVGRVPNDHYYVQASPSFSLQFTELCDNLSPESRACLDRLATFDDQISLHKALRSSKWRNRVSEMAGVDISNLETMKRELQSKAAVFV